MSTNDPNTVKTETEKVDLKKKYEYFDENLVLQSKEVPVSFEVFTVDAKLENVMVKLNAINRWIDAANYLIRNEALKAARTAAGVSGGINREVLMNFIKPYRELPQFASMISASDKRKATAEEWDKQTGAILEQIKNVPFVINSIKELSAKANSEESDA